MRFTVALIAGIVLFGGVAVAQQQVGVELRVDTRSLEEGEIVAAQLICTNTGDPATPQWTVPEGLELRLTNPTPARSSMTSIINGRTLDTTGGAGGPPG